MKKSGLLLALSLTSIMLAACAAGGDETSSSSVSSEVSSSETVSSSTGAISTTSNGFKVLVSTTTRWLTADEEISGYSYALPHFKLSAAKNNATSDLALDDSALTLPAGSLFTVTITTDTYNFFDTYTTLGGEVLQTYLEFADETSASTSLTYTNGSGTVSGNLVNLTFADTDTKTFGFTPSAEVKLSRVSIVYGYIS